MQFVFFGEQCFLHAGELPDELVETFTHGIPLYVHHLRAIGKLPMSCMNVYLHSHVLSLSHGRPAMITMGILFNCKFAKTSLQPVIDE